MLESNTEYTHNKFIDLKANKQEFNRCCFESCTFQGCNFDECVFTSCKFIECSFSDCSLNLIQPKACSFVDCDFNECNMKGINWTQIHFPYVTINSPIYFKGCDVSYSSFFELTLPSIIISACKAHEVDFRGADLSDADLGDSDLKHCMFNNTKLDRADLRNCINYAIDPRNNSLGKASFSLPDALSLLRFFDIHIE